MDILLIEDDVGLLTAMGLVLRDAGYSVLEAADGDEGLWLFQSRGARLVVTDLMMPARDGFETITAIKKEQPAARILAISGGLRSGAGDLLAIALAVGADEVLAKPFALEDLLATVRRLAPRAH